MCINIESLSCMPETNRIDPSFYLFTTVTLIFILSLLVSVLIVSVKVNISVLYLNTYDFSAISKLCSMKHYFCRILMEFYKWPPIFTTVELRSNGEKLCVQICIGRKKISAAKSSLLTPLACSALMDWFVPHTPVTP